MKTKLNRRSVLKGITALAGGTALAAQPHLRSALDIYQRLALAMPHESHYAENVQRMEAALQTISLASAKI